MISGKLQNLYIRACKSKHPELRLFSLYKRFYLCDMKKDEYNRNNRAIKVKVKNLLYIIQRFKLCDLLTMHDNVVERINLFSMIENKENNNVNNFANEYVTYMLISCINVIRFSAVSDFEDYLTETYETIKFKKRLYYYTYDNNRVHILFCFYII